MAYDLMAIRKEHIDSLRRVIKEAPYTYLKNVCSYAGVETSLDSIMSLIDSATMLGIINKEDPDYSWKSFLTSRIAIEEHLRGYDNFLQDVPIATEKAISIGALTENEPDFLLKSFAFTIFNHKNHSIQYSTDDARAFICDYLETNPFLEDSPYYVYSELMYPLQMAILFITKNNPIGLASLLKKQAPEGEESKSKYMRVPLSEAFAFLKEMTLFGNRRLLADICPSYCEDELVESIQNGDYDGFKEICRSEKLTLSTELSESVGYLQYMFYIPFERMFNEETNNETIEKEGDPYNSFILYSSGYSPSILNNISSAYALERGNIMRQFPWIQTEEEFQWFSQTTLFISSMYTYFDLFEVDEAEEVNTIFKNPRLLFLVKFAQGLYHDCYHRWPKNAKILFSAEEVEAVNTEETLAQAKNHLPTNGGQTESPAIHVSSEEKTLASRWMTEQYHRMTDDVLVEIVSKKIWPQLQDEVDGLQWTPAKRALPTFQKTKNMMAACILFHALELSGIAKLPKQEKDDYNYVGLYGEEDRAQSGVYTTSKLRAGVTSTKKKYNDTLPVGYMEVLEKFIPESDMPGRTTSRTYLKLLNTWVKKSFESIRDNIDSEASAKLYIAECKQDLGAQFYLYQDNKKQMKAMLTEWRDALPALFNVPI